MKILERYFLSSYGLHIETVYGDSLLWLWPWFSGTSRGYRRLHSWYSFGFEAPFNRRKEARQCWKDYLKCTSLKD